MSKSKQNVYVVFNPVAGSTADAQTVRDTLAKHFASPEWTCDVYETTGKKDEDIAGLCRAAIKKGADLVVSAGGDGTLVGVANGLIHSKIPLGILPLGTGNDLARILGIPLKLEDALDLLCGDHNVFEMDALKVNDRYYFSNVSVGITPEMMKDTNSDSKKRFGRLAYLWTMFKQSRIFQMRQYILTLDNKKQYVNAVEIMVSNTTLLEAPPSLFGSLDTLNDGKLEVYLVRARTWRDYLQMAWGLIRHQPAPKLTHQEAEKTIHIQAVRHSQLVQADGEVIGHTPVDIELERNALKVVLPKPAKETEKPLVEKILQPHAG